MNDLAPESTNTITQDNQLVEACYSMTLTEKRLLMLGMSRVDPRQFPRESEPLRFTLTVSDWERCFQDENPYRAMKRAADSLMTRYVTLHPETGITKKLSWFDSVEYHDNEASVTVQFGRSIQVRLAGMLEQFTKVSLLSVGPLRSIYSIRLYELLAQYKSREFKTAGWREIKIGDFRVAMDAVRKYPRLAELKRRILIPAIREINESSDLAVEFSDVRVGRKITAFRLKFRDQPRANADA